MKVKLGLLTDIDTLLMVQKGFRGEIYHATHRHVRAIKGYDTKT